MTRILGRRFIENDTPTEVLFFYDLTTNEPASSKMETIQKLLQGYANELADRDVVVTETRVRFASK